MLAWIDDRHLQPAIHIQRVDPLGRTQGDIVRLPSGPNPSRPRLASTGRELCLIYGDLDDGGSGRVMLQLLDLELRPLLDEPRELTTTDAAHGAGLTYHEGKCLVGVAAAGGLDLHSIEVLQGDGAPAGDAGPDAAPSASRSSSGYTVRVDRRTVPTVEGVTTLGNIALLSHGGRLFLASDHPEGWSIQIAEVTQEQVRRVSQVIDDRRNPTSRWCCPTLGPVPNGRLALLWQGPGMALTSLHFLVFDLDGHPQGRELPFEGRVVDEASGQFAGRGPVFHPVLAPAPYGLLAAFTDNRYANSEILLAPFSCTE